MIFCLTLPRMDGASAFEASFIMQSCTIYTHETRQDYESRRIDN